MSTPNDCHSYIFRDLKGFIIFVVIFLFFCYFCYHDTNSSYVKPLRISIENNQLFETQSLLMLWLCRWRSQTLSNSEAAILTTRYQIFCLKLIHVQGLRNWAIPFSFNDIRQIKQISFFIFLRVHNYFEQNFWTSHLFIMLITI